MIFQYATQTSEKIYLTKNETKIEIIKVGFQFAAQNLSLWTSNRAHGHAQSLSIIK